LWQDSVTCSVRPAPRNSVHLIELHRNAVPCPKGDSAYTLLPVPDRRTGTHIPLRTHGKGPFPRYTIRNPQTVTTAAFITICCLLLAHEAMHTVVRGIFLGGWRWAVFMALADKWLRSGPGLRPKSVGRALSSIIGVYFAGAGALTAIAPEAGRRRIRSISEMDSDLPDGSCRGTSSYFWRNTALMRTITPSIEAGPIFRTASNLNGTNPSNHGIAAGLGAEGHFWKIRLAPQFRYLRWARDRSRPNGH
jgi:hypothetical protein